MKYVFFICALYMTALSVYPCYEEECVDEVGVVNNTDHDHENEDADLCTPFCVSACCGIHAFCSAPFTSVPADQHSITQNTNYTLKFTPTVVVSIWQPPKLACA